MQAQTSRMTVDALSWSGLILSLSIKQPFLLSSRDDVNRYPRRWGGLTCSNHNVQPLAIRRVGEGRREATDPSELTTPRRRLAVRVCSHGDSPLACRIRDLPSNRSLFLRGCSLPEHRQCIQDLSFLCYHGLYNGTAQSRAASNAAKTRAAFPGRVGQRRAELVEVHAGECERGGGRGGESTHFGLTGGYDSGCGRRKASGDGSVDRLSRRLCGQRPGNLHPPPRLGGTGFLHI
ncbi:hypothetical protein DFP72DRAFT_858397 [Ephemerocybe angulata]|uniref:Uncharacterized protein n=1 Tax=Ephemerocybe angulata TaxID=980116 RepID=A0A8H6HC61_9AGAR|nr:hypothetical protein DFP72DRAFT_858397 [Tulosesus angulatus]